MSQSVLLIEPDPRLREFWQKTLSLEGFQIISITQLEIADTVDPVPELVFIGSGLEGAKGTNLLQRLKARRADIVVIAPLNSTELKQELEAMERDGHSSDTIRVEPVSVAIRQAFKVQAAKVDPFPELVGASPATRQVKEMIHRLASSEATTVLIQGETGTGKELVARLIHAASPRREHPFVEVGCTQVPETLLESELFGYEAGAFTDAKQAKPGLMEQAEGGSLFLDEVGDMPSSMQAKLLSVLEEKRFRRLGGVRDHKVNVRIITATNRDLEALVDQRDFREDLYFRLKVFPIHLLPLRDRKEDIKPLAVHFIHHFNRELKKSVKGLSFAALQALESYHWPGNVRELRNLIEHAMIMADGERLSPHFFPVLLESQNQSLTSAGPKEGLTLDEVERQAIQGAMERAKGNQTLAARMLGISRFALRNRLKKFMTKI